MEPVNVPDVLRWASLEPEAAAAELRAALDAGAVWRVSLFAMPAFAAQAAHPAVAPLVDEARRRMDAHRFRAALEVMRPERAGVTPLLIAFHGARGSAAFEVDAWRPATSLGYTVAAVQSSQPSAPGLFCWDDRERIEADLAATLPALPAHGRTVVAGFSQGAWLALRLALEGRRLPRSAACVLVCPFVGDLDGLPPMARRLRVHVLAGAEDPYTERVHLLAERLRAAGHEAAVEVIEGLGHAYPDDFAARVPGLLAAVRRPPH